MTKKILFTLLLFIATLAFSQKSLMRLSAAPNPFVNNTNIKFESTKDQSVFLTVKNVLGKTVYNKKHKINKDKNAIPFSKDKLKSGLYIYIIRNNKELITKRFVIK